MELTRRFVFRGHASACSGRILRPKHVVISTPAASSLTAEGGLSEAGVKSARFEHFSAGRAYTKAEGSFDDRKQAVELTYGRVAEDTLTTTTKVGASVEKIVIGRKPKVEIARLAGSLTSHSGTPGEEPSITLGRETAINGVVIDGYELSVVLNKKVFASFDTHSKLAAAAGDPAFIEETGDCLFRRSTTPRVVRRVRAAVAPPARVLFGTLVKSLKWRRKAHPNAVIDGHSVAVDGLGTLYFGEIFVTEESRRVTMLRARLGSPVGGMVAFAEYETNGSWYPPTI